MSPEEVERMWRAADGLSAAVHALWRELYRLHEQPGLNFGPPADCPTEFCQKAKAALTAWHEVS